MSQRRKSSSILLSLLLFALLLALVACGEGESPSGTESQATAGDATASPSEAASEGETEQASEAPTEEESLPAYGGSHTLALPESDGGVKEFTVVLDAGHGQRDPGNMAGEVKESDINLALVKRLGEIFTEMGYRVLYAREDDRAMLGDDPSYNTEKEAEARRHFAVREGADLYISIHCNAAQDEKARGTRIFYNARPVTSFDGRLLANAFKEQLNIEFSRELAASSLPEVKNHHVNGMQEDIYIVLQDVRLPAVLVEIGFMTNEEELALLLQSDYLWEYAHALALGADEARKTVLNEEKE